MNTAPQPATQQWTDQNNAQTQAFINSKNAQTQAFIDKQNAAKASPGFKPNGNTSPTVTPPQSQSFGGTAFQNRQMQQQYGMPPIGPYGSAGGNTPANGMPNYNANTQIYSPQQSRGAVNLARAQLHQQTTLPGLLEKMARPGMGSESPFQVGQAYANYIGPAQAASQMAGVQIPFGDAEANAQNRLQYEDMAAGQAIGYGNVANRVQQAQRNANLQSSGTLAQLLAGFI